MRTGEDTRRFVSSANILITGDGSRRSIAFRLAIMCSPKLCSPGGQHFGEDSKSVLLAVRLVVGWFVSSDASDVTRPNASSAAASARHSVVSGTVAGVALGSRPHADAASGHSHGAR